MNPPKLSVAVAISLGIAVIVSPLAQAAMISKVYVGAFSNSFQDPNDPSGVKRGGKYVVKTSFDTADLTLVLGSAGRSGITRDTYVVALDDVPGAPGSKNTYELFVPTPNYGILTQTGPDHYVIDATTAQTAEIQFFNTCNSAATCASQFRGFEFESNYLRTNDPVTPAATDLVFEQFTADANDSGTQVTNYVVNLLDENLTTVGANLGTTDVRSESASPSGGQANPGVFFREADPIVAEAGATPLVYSAGQLSVTTNAGTELVTETAAPIVPGQLRSYPSTLDEQPRQADNDLGAGRTDKEDFLSYDWNINAVSLAGNLDGSRLDRTVTGAPAYFDNIGTRAVSNVNRDVAIENSGLTTTVDTTSFGLTVTEAMTGLSDTDTVGVSYQNAPVTSADAGPALVYDAANLTRTADGSVVDPDLAVNALIPGFEAHTFEWKQGATTVGTTEDVALGIASSGLTHANSTATLDLTATDRAGTSQSDSTGVSYVNAGPTADAGPNVVFDASNLTQTADGSVSDPDLAVNAQIAGFESHSFEWKLGAALLGSVEDLSLGIVASGLMTTTDTATLDFTATDFAGASDSDTTGVSYANALPTIATASATAMGDDLLFELDFDDLDLGVNTLIPGFEQLSVQILVDMIDSTALFGDLIANGSQLLDQATLLGTFGEGSHLFEARISDRMILASGGATGPVTGGFQFEVAAAPEPATLGLLALGAAGLGGSLRRRRKAVRGGDGR
jgi:hypothetical protein